MLWQRLTHVLLDVVLLNLILLDQVVIGSQVRALLLAGQLSLGPCGQLSMPREAHAIAGAALR